MEGWTLYSLLVFPPILSYNCLQSMTSTLVFFLYMVRHPEIQEKARQEIDRVIGRDRLPTIVDSDKLPYVSSIFIEVLRICPSVPTGKQCTIIPCTLTSSKRYPTALLQTTFTMVILFQKERQSFQIYTTSSAIRNFFRTPTHSTQIDTTFSTLK